MGNRDWIIPIECTADAVVLYPGKMRFGADALSAAQSEDNPLLKAVYQAIQRRQATVLPGEPPYRPLIRFQVRPDGLRAYYLAYPCLQRLQVPMTREDLEAQEEIRLGSY